MQLYCFTHAGGNAGFFNSLESLLAPLITVEKLEYAGHGCRYREKFYTDFSELSEDMYGQVCSRYKKGTTYALFGYSMGSISAIETLKQIMKKGEIALPSQVFLAAHEPCARKELEGFDEESLNEWIQERTIQFGGIPEVLIHNRSFWQVYLPIYRADYRMLSKYDFLTREISRDIPATVFYSEMDTPYSKMKEWKHYFTGECEMIPFEGNHFFIFGHEREIAGIVLKKMELQEGMKF